MKTETMGNQFQITLDQQLDFKFEVRFDNPAIPTLTTDEPAPLGSDQGPNPSRLLGAAVANCLAASLLFAMKKFKNDPSPMHAVATVSVVRNEQNRMRIGAVAVDLQIGVLAEKVEMLERVLSQFEDFCVVTQSIRTAIPVTVRVIDASDAVLHVSTGR